MTQLTLPHHIETDTTADAVEVEQNYAQIASFVNANLINRDGSVAMQEPLLLDADPTQPLHAATKAYVDAIMPVGIIMPYGGAAAPAGSWRLCNGGGMTVSSWPKLFAVIGYRYGGSGATFNVPNLSSRVPIGVDSGDTRFNVTGKTGGTYEAQLAAHTHTITHNHASFSTGAQSASHTHNFSDTTSSAGAHQHNGYWGTMYWQDGSSYRALAAPNDPSGIITQSAGAHTHTLSGTTAAQNSSHTHTADVPSFTGNSGSAGTSGVDQIPEFVVVSYIIRVD